MGRNRFGRISLVLALLLTIACQPAEVEQETAAANVESAAAPAQTAASTPAYDPTPKEAERDRIFTLLAYAVVLKDWQGNEEKPRGYNIGSILVDPDDNVVCWARNSVDVTGNETQHGEVRLMTNYLRNTKKFALKQYKLYTTLEPCAMCSGMMTLSEIYATIYGQSDPNFGDAIQRLELNSTAIGGYTPYPRAVLSIASDTDVRQDIDEAYAQTSQRSITAWLAGEQAKGFFTQALEELQTMTVEYPENEATLAAARSFLESVPDIFTPLWYETSCPGA